jgi:hypothetical protein
MTIAAHSAETKDQRSGSPLEVLLVFLRLGITCFGGPIAHIGYFRDEGLFAHDDTPAETPSAVMNRQSTASSRVKKRRRSPQSRWAVAKSMFTAGSAPRQ